MSIEPQEPLARVEALIEELQAGGQVERGGHFTLDRDTAREKLQRYQLKDPLGYLSELVRAAVLRGAQRIAFFVDADDVWMHFDGAPFTGADFEELYAALFTSADSRSAQSLAALAIGLNTALTLPILGVRVSSYDGTGGATFAASCDRREEHRPLPEGARAKVLRAGWTPTTTIHVQRRFALDLLKRAFDDVYNRLPEEEWIRARCRHATAEITLDGQTVSQGYVLPARYRAVPIAGHGFEGCSGLDRLDKSPGRAVLVAAGVFISESAPPGLPRGALALVASDDFQLDLSRSEVVQDALYQRAMDAATGALASR